MFIDEEYGNLKVVVDSEYLTRNNNRKRKSEVVTNAIDEIKVSMIFLWLHFFV